MKFLIVDLVKPFSFADLLARVRTILCRRKAVSIFRASGEIGSREQP